MSGETPSGGPAVEQSSVAQEADAFFANNFGNPGSTSGRAKQIDNRLTDQDRVVQDADSFFVSNFSEAAPASRSPEQQVDDLFQRAIGVDSPSGQAEIDAQAAVAAELARYSSGRKRGFHFRRSVRGSNQPAEQQAINQARETIFAHTAHSTIRTLKIFGRRLSDIGLDRQILNAIRYTLTHKREIWDYARSHKAEMLAGAGFGSATRWATRLAVTSLLAGSGVTIGPGIAIAAVSGAVGGAAAAAAKEVFFRQADQLAPGEKAFIVAGIKNGFRKLKAADKEKIMQAAKKGAVFGFVGGAIGSEIAKHIAEAFSASPSGTVTAPGSAETAQPTRTQTPFRITKHAITADQKGSISSPATEPSATAAPKVEPSPSPTTAPVTETAPAAAEGAETSGAESTGATEPASADQQPPTLPDTEPHASADTQPATPPAAQPASSAPVLTETAPAVVSHVSETITLPKGSNVWTEVKNYLEQNLGDRPLNDSELADLNKVVHQVMTDNDIADPTKVAVGKSLDIHSVNEYLNQVKGAQAVAAAPAEVTPSSAAEPAVDVRAAEVGQNAITEQPEVEHALAEKVSDALDHNPDLFREVTIGKGATAGTLLQLGWNAADAPVMGANIAANYDTLTEMWAGMAKTNPDLLPNTHFPVSMSEIDDLVRRAVEDGDELALRRLRQALHWIPAGSKLRLIAEQQARAVLDKVA